VRFWETASKSWADGLGMTCRADGIDDVESERNYQGPGLSRRNFLGLASGAFA
jgi:hypothetical protein